MTAQVSEKLFHNGTNYALCAEPLEKYLKEQRPDIDFVWDSTACWRGYQGTWQIREGKLYLTGLEGRLRKPGERMQFPEKFPENDPDAFKKCFPDLGEDGLFAGWFSGEVFCPYGDLLDYRHAGFGSVYRHELVITFNNGIVVSEVEKVNIVPSGGFRRQAD